MIYQKTISIPRGTLSSSPLVSELQLTKGLLYRAEIYFPPGPCGLAGVRVLSDSLQLYPFNADEWFTGNNVLISFEDTYLVYNPPYIFRVEGYNDDTLYDHSVQIRVGLLSDDALISRFLPDQSMDKLIAYFEAQKQQSGPQLSQSTIDKINAIQGIV